MFGVCMFRVRVLLAALFWFSGIGIGAAATDASRLSLTASDGTGLSLTHLRARVVLEGFLAFTELELSFHNPEDRRREGRFQMVLPEGAAISRFAMEVGGVLQEGEVVETALARRAYEDFLHRRQDPALLETDSGNRFNARIFPIEPHEHKRLVLSYSQRLVDGDFVLPLLGLPQLAELEIRLYHDDTTGETQALGGFTATSQQRQVLSVHEEDFLPSADFRVPRDLLPGLTLRGEDWLAARLVPLSDSNPAPVEDLLLLVDTSASQAPHLAATVSGLQALLEHLRPSSVRLVAFDQEVVDLGSATEPAGWAALLAKLSERPALGASRLDGLLDELARLEWLADRALLVSDMVITAGETDPPALREALAKLPGLERLDVLLPGYHQDRALAEQLARAVPAAGVVVSMAEDPEILSQRLTRDLVVDLPVTVSGADWYWPETIPALQAGQAVLVFARLDGTATPEIRVAGESQALQVQAVEPLLLHREAVRGRLDKLLAMEANSRDGDLKRALHREIIDLSVRQRVLSPYTSLLVLETEADYARYDIDRQALAGVLAVGADGLEVIQRTGRHGGELPIAITGENMNQLAVPMGDGEISPLPEGDALLESRSSAAQRIATPEMAESAEVPALAPLMAEEPLGRLPMALSPPPDDVVISGAAADAAPPPVSEAEAPPSDDLDTSPEPQPVVAAAPPPPSAEPWSGRYRDFRALLDGDAEAALAEAQTWRSEEAADLMALIALGEAAEALGDAGLAARAYGSLIDYFPGRADIRRWAAERLLALGEALWLATDSLEKASLDRPDHPSVHLLLALARWQNAEHRAAVEVLDRALERDYPRFDAAQRILQETRDLLLGVLADEGRMDKLFPGRDRQGQKGPMLSFLLVWETDANDVDLHVHDGQGNHAYYQQMALPSGGRLYADITTGYGPEAFGIHEPNAFPYRLAADYYNRGPMGYGMGAILVLDYRPGQGLQLQTRPFVVMNDKAMLDLGEVSR